MVKKVIAGALYDTDTARLLCLSDVDPDDYLALYRTKSGRFFKVVMRDEGIFDGTAKHQYEEVIIPVERRKAIVEIYRTVGPEKAKDLLERRDEGVKQVSLRLPMWAYNTLRETAAERGVSMARVVCDMLEGDNGEYLADYNDEERYFDGIASLPENELRAFLEEVENRNARNAEIICTHRNTVDKGCSEGLE